MRCFVSWSGGKDSCLALWRARRSGAEIGYLVTTYSGKTGRTMAHGFPLELVRAQAEALGVELVAVGTGWEEYEVRFKAAIAGLRERGVEAGVFGDIDLPEHREWVERVSREAGLDALLPLWGADQSDLLREWVNEGFTAVIVAVRSDLGLEWLGRRLDRRCLAELDRALTQRGLSPSGESGEYHTLVVDGPLFQRPLEVHEAVPVLRGRHWMLDIREFGLGERRSGSGA
ncbi:MAG: diphthine--ammonia ligase [Bacillota bacterium]|nr:diphthine--ammonia ligase [Bacillota bacterium]MDI7249310.1 diphthine--ammonia ligase [Bacillota bacterium]